MTKTWFKLAGITKTPIVSRRKRFEVEDIGVVTVHGRLRTFGKLTKGERRAPMTFRAWYGDVEMVVLSHNLEEALAIDTLGRYTNEGMGQIQWQEAKKLSKKPLHIQHKITIRKMLPTNLSETQQKLLIAFLLHDCVHTERHNSKIYNEVSISDNYVAQLVKNHHNYVIGDREIPLLSTLQYYDRHSSGISRKFRFSARSRYRLSELEKIDFPIIARELEQRQHSLYALYTYVRKSQDLKKINEALSYAFSSFKNHLLLMVNLYLDELI